MALNRAAEQETTMNDDSGDLGGFVAVTDGNIGFFLLLSILDIFLAPVYIIGGLFGFKIELFPDENGVGQIQGGDLRA